MTDHSSNLIRGALLVCAAIAGLLHGAAPARAVDSYHDYYEYYAHYGAGFDTVSHDDDWFYDFYEFKADASASAFDAELSDYDYDRDEFAWEEYDLFD
jgi:hypothetical protein